MPGSPAAAKRTHETQRTCVVITDITAFKSAEESLRKARDELELRVEERTSELMTANEALHNEIAERTRAEEELRRSRDRLEARVQERTEELRRQAALVERARQAYDASR